MNAMIQELGKLSTAETVTPEQFRQLAMIVLELAQQLAKKQNGPSHAGLRDLPRD